MLRMAKGSAAGRGAGTAASPGGTALRTPARDRGAPVRRRPHQYPSTG